MNTHCTPNQEKPALAAIGQSLVLEELTLTPEHRDLLKRAAAVAKEMLADPESPDSKRRRAIEEELRAGEQPLLEVAKASERLTQNDLAVRIMTPRD